jgi:branched-subunit amino acid aminotransferase/4-amino-4-deoxychorismate lyase
MWTLDGYIKELTFLNVFVLLKSRYGNLELITPPDDGCIYNGSIRKSIIEMRDEIKADFDLNPLYNEGRKDSFNIIEKELDVCELASATREDRLLEIFCGSSFCNIQPILSIQNGTDLISSRPSDFPMVKYLNNKFMDIMTGTAEHRWISHFDSRINDF